MFKVGTSVADISPSKGIELCGYAARNGGNVGINDPLFAKALAIDDGMTRVAIVSCDLVGLDSDFIEHLAREANREIGIDTGNVMVCCSHTHAGPVTMSSNGIGARSEEYMSELEEKLLRTLTASFADLKPADAYYMRGTCNIGINRGGRIPKGSIEPIPDPDGFVDNAVSVIEFCESGTDKPLCVLFNYGCHPTTLGPEAMLVSADYPGAACEFVNRRLGGNVTTMFTDGGAGNVDPVLRGSYEEARLNGEKLGEAVMATLKSRRRQLPVALEVSSVEVILPYANVAEQDFQEILSEHSESINKTSAGSVEQKLSAANIRWAKRWLKEIANDRLPQQVPVRMQAIRIGDVDLVGIPVEPFAETTAWIREQSAGDAIVLGYANGDVGYLPTREEIEKGGYEVFESHKYMDRPAHFTGEAESNVRSAALSLISILNHKSKDKS